MKGKATSAYVAAIGGGATLWFATAAVSGKAEAWDSSLYWSAAYPLTIGLAGYLGYRTPEKPWRWGLAAMLAQAVLLTVSGSDFGLLPLGLLLFSVLAHLMAKLASRSAKV